MPLSADAQALLELILTKDQSYADLAGLLDVPEDEVRARARGALRELSGGVDPDRNVPLTDWLLGQADPIGRAEAARHLREDVEDSALAGELLTSLASLAPEAVLPHLPGSPGGARRIRRPKAPRAAPAAEPKGGGPAQRSRLSSLSSHQTRLIVALGSGAILLVAIVLAVTGAFGGSDETGSDSSSASGATTADQPTEDIQTIPLEPSGSGDAQGTATFAIAGGSTAFVDLEIEKLEPAPNGQAYILWLLVSEDQGHPLTPFQVDRDGTFSDQIPIESFLTQLAARTQAVDVSLSESRPLLAEVEDAVAEGTPVIKYTGESVLRGVVEPAATGDGSGGSAGGQGG